MMITTPAMANRAAFGDINQQQRPMMMMMIRVQVSSVEMESFAFHPCTAAHAMMCPPSLEREREHCVGLLMKSMLAFNAHVLHAMEKCSNFLGLLPSHQPAGRRANHFLVTLICDFTC